MRAHNAVLGPSKDSNVTLGALDHDWKIAGIVSSVNLFVDIPENMSTSFFSGNPHVAIKERVFESSSPMRHATELHGQILEMIDNGEQSKEILTIVTDGGGDHNVTHAPVQVALICLFFHLNVDMLVAMRTCPTQSWTNVAERVMSILNFALQHCATERDSMYDNCWISNGRSDGGLALERAMNAKSRKFLHYILRSQNKTSTEVR